MLRNNRAFSLIDSIAAMSLFLTIALTMLPMLKIITLEHENIQIRSSMLSTLYNELLIVEEGHPQAITKSITIENIKGTIHITPKENSWEGCISWSNLKNTLESKCLYVSKEPTS